jgi:hypothetical protein
VAPKVKDSKSGTYAKLQNELDPLHEDFHVMTMAETRARLDKLREQAKQSEQKRQISTPTPTPTPRASPKPTPINLFFQIIAQNNLQDIKIIKIIFNMLQLCSKNHELII